MIGQHQLRVYLPGVFRQRLALPLAQGRTPHIVPRAGAGIACRKLNFPCHKPTGGILQVQVNAEEIRLPSIREGNAGIAGGKAFGGGILQCPRRNATGYQVNAVRVNHGNGMDGRRLLDGAGIHAPQCSAGGDAFCQLLYKFQQQRGGNPLVAMVGSGKKHLPLAAANDQCFHGSAKSSFGENLLAAAGVGFCQSVNGLAAQGSGHGYIGFYNSQNTSPHIRI